MKAYLIFIILATILGGCAITEKPVSLKELEAGYQALSNEQNVRDNAPQSLENTGILVQKTKSTWKNEGEGDAYEHQHYLASRSTEITELLAEQKVMQASLAAAKTQQQSLKLAIEAEENTKTLVIVKDDVLFGFDKAELHEAAENRLQQLTKYLKQNPDATVMVEGHADAIGSAQYNMKLSAQRAESVAQALVGKGIARDRIQLKAYGEHDPIASNQTDKGRQYNRRAEIIIPDIEE